MDIESIQQQVVSDDDLFRFFDTFYRFSESIEADPETLKKIDLIRKELIKIVFPTPTLNADIGIHASIQSNTKEKGQSNKEDEKFEIFKCQYKGCRIEIKTFFMTPQTH